MCKNRGGLNPALKPGPVVPPGIEKAPNQAARKTQSVKKCHLSDILGFLGGVSIFVIFHVFDFLLFHFLMIFDFYILSLFLFF